MVGGPAGRNERCRWMWVRVGGGWSSQVEMRDVGGCG